MFHVELQHHKVTPYSSFFFFFFQAFSLQTMTHHGVCGDVTPRHQSPSSERKLARWPDSVTRLLFKQMVWYHRLAGRRRQYDHRDAWHVYVWWFSFTSARREPVPRPPSASPAQHFDRRSLTWAFTNMEQDKAADGMPGWKVIKHVATTCFQFLAQSSWWCSATWKGGLPPSGRWSHKTLTPTGWLYVFWKGSFCICKPSTSLGGNHKTPQIMNGGFRGDQPV